LRNKYAKCRGKPEGKDIAKIRVHEAGFEGKPNFENPFVCELYIS
jgi:hypothetical protein